MIDKSCSVFCKTAWHRLVLATLLAFAGGCTTTLPHSDPGKSTLWKIRSATNTVYLMGSVHILPTTAYPLKPAMNRAFADSQRVVFEIALDDHGVEAESIQAGLYPKGQKLSQHLSPETLALLRACLPGFELTLEKVERFRPWFVSELLTNLYLSRQGYQSKRGLDLHFFERAQKAGKMTSGLETVQAQSRAFRQFSDSDSDKYLRETLLSFPAIDRWFRQMIRAWRNGDAQTLDVMINSSAPSGREFYKSIFDDRNSAWMPAIRSFIGARQNVLVIVGTGHLVGKKGIIEQLRREGYLVEQL